MWGVGTVWGKVKVKVICPEAWIKETLPVARWLGVGLTVGHQQLVHTIHTSDAARREGAKARGAGCGVWVWGTKRLFTQTMPPALHHQRGLS